MPPALRPVCSAAFESATGSNCCFFRDASRTDAPGYWLEWRNDFACVWRCVGLKAEQVAAFEPAKLNQTDFSNSNGAKKSRWFGGLARLFSSIARKEKEYEKSLKIVQVLEQADGFLLVIRFGASEDEGGGVGFVKADRETFSISSTFTPLLTKGGRGGGGVDFRIICSSGQSSDSMMMAVSVSACQEYKNGTWKRCKRWDSLIDDSVETEKVSLVCGQFLCCGSSLVRMADGKRFALPVQVSEKNHFILKADDYLYCLQSDRALEVCLETGAVRQQPIPECARFFSPSNELFVQFDSSSRHLQLFHFSLSPHTVEPFVCGPVGEAVACPFERVVDAVFGETEVFLLDSCGAVWSHVVPSAIEPVPVSYCPVEELEFAHIFNILGPFPIASPQFYWARRGEFASGLLCFDEAIKETLGPNDCRFGVERFPPTNWPALSQFCRDLFKECPKVTDAAMLVLYLLWCADRNDTTRHEIFCKEFGIGAVQMARIRLFWLIDHGEAEEACAHLLRNAAHLRVQSWVMAKLIQTALDKNCDFWELAKFAPGNLVSLDDFLAHPALLESCFCECLRRSPVIEAVDGIKCLFARMKPSDSAAQIPVPQLHLQVLTCMLEALLKVRGEDVFLCRAMELVELPFEQEIVACFTRILQVNDENDPSQRKRILLKLFLHRKATVVASADSGASSISLLSTASTECLLSSTSSAATATGSGAADPLARFFQKNSPTSSPLRPSASTSQTASPARPLHLKPNSPLQHPRHFPPKQPTRLSQATDEDAPVVLAETRPLAAKRRGSRNELVFDDEGAGEIAMFPTKEHPPVPSRQSKRRRK